MERTRARSSRGRRVALILTGVVVLIAAVIVVVILRRVPAAPAGSVDIPDDQPVEVVFGLTRDQAGLQAYAAGAGPVLPLSDIASRFGASLAVRHQVSNRRC